MSTTTFAAWLFPPGVEEPSRVSMAPGEEDELALRHPVLSGDEAREICRTLRRSRAALLATPFEALIQALGGVGQRFLDPEDPLREEALDLVRANAGVSPAMAWEIVDGMARDWIPDRIRALVNSELPDPAVLDGFRKSSSGRVRALGPELVVHVGAGNVPGVSVSSLIRALVIKSPVLLKPGRTDAVLPVLFARELAAAHGELAGSFAVVYWTGGEEMVEGAVLSEARHVVVHGGEETVAAVRERLPATTALTAYHHRVSFGVVGRAALDPEEAGGAAAHAARAVALFDQRGCVSPHLFYVEEGGATSPREWTRLLAEALAALSGELPRGALRPDEASAIQQARGAAEIRAAADPGSAELVVPPDLEWTVIYEEDPEFQPSCLGRVVRVKPVPDAGDVAELVAPIGAFLQTAGVVGLARRMDEVAESLARVGVSRIAPLVDMPWPPPWWHHDGMGPLRVLLRWIEVEEGGA